MPTPPAFLTARLLSTRALTPRRQRTILPLTCPALSLLFPVALEMQRSPFGPGATTAASTMPTAPDVPRVTEAPSYVAPLPSAIVPARNRLCVFAPTVVTHGTFAGLKTVAAPGPSLPA